MNPKRFQKFVAVFVFTFFAMSASLVTAPGKVSASSTYPCSLNPHVKKRSIPKRMIFSKAMRNSSVPLECGQNAQCQNISGTYNEEEGDTVAGEYGVYYYDTLWEKQLFMPMYTYTAQPVAGTKDEYAMANWDRKMFFIQVNSDMPPEPMQSRYMCYNEETGWHEFISKSGRYRQAGQDYSDYPDEEEYKSAIMELELYVDSENQVIDYTMRVFDKDGNYAEDRKLEIGDEVDLPLWGTCDEDPGWEFGASFELFFDSKPVAGVHLCLMGAGQRICLR